MENTIFQKKKLALNGKILLTINEDTGRSVLLDRNKSSSKINVEGERSRNVSIGNAFKKNHSSY